MEMEAELYLPDKAANIKLFSENFYKNFRGIVETVMQRKCIREDWTLLCWL